MVEAEKYIAKIAGEVYEPVEHKKIERVKVITAFWATKKLIDILWTD